MISGKANAMKSFGIFVAWAVGYWLVCGDHVVWGQNSCCDECGRQGNCQRVCCLKFEEKKVTETLWAGKCEEICLPGKSQCIESRCEMIGDQEPTDELPCAKPKKFVWNVWQPSLCSTPAMKSKLMKRTIVKSVPTHKWVFENLCPECEATKNNGK